MFGAILLACFVPYAFALGNPSLGNKWVDTWTAMPQLTEFTNLPPPPFVGKDAYLAFHS